MPDRNVHAIATVLVGVTTAAGLALYGFPAPEIAATLVGFTLTLAIHPDLDVNRSRPRKAALLPFWLFFYPYSRLIPHRHWLSHAPVIGTLLRVAYLLLILAPAVRLLGLTLDPALINYILAGMIVSDMVHMLLDVTTTFLKRKTHWLRIRST